MEPAKRRRDIPIFLLHDIDPQWELHEQKAAQILINELQNEGHRVVDVQVTHHSLETVLKSYNPDDYILFNWCESLPGDDHSEHIVTTILENKQFIYTGSPSDILFFSWNKAAIKKLLQIKNIPTPDGIVTYNSKFKPGTSDYENITIKIPAQLDNSQFTQLNKTALKAYRALGCQDYARIDIRLKDGTFYILDINPNPRL